MTIDGRSAMTWLVSLVLLLVLLVIGRPLLVPLALAIVVWAVLNALVDILQSLKFPRWLAWPSAFALIMAAVYLAARVLVNDGGALAARVPGYVAELEVLARSWLAFLHLRSTPSLVDLLGQTNIAGMLARVAASAGRLLFDSIGVAVYATFLLLEQHTFSAKLARLGGNAPGQQDRERLIRAIARQVQSYLGVCTLMSLVMAITSFAILKIFKVEFAGFWALFMFVLTYIPYIGAVGVLLPALVALVQLGLVGPFLIIAISLGATHLVLTNIVQTVLLGRSLNLSLLAIILSLSLWGLIWGVAGLFLAVPILGATVIVCQHIDGLRWVAILLARPVPEGIDTAR